MTSSWTVYAECSCEDEDEEAVYAEIAEDDGYADLATSSSSRTTLSPILLRSWPDHVAEWNLVPRPNIVWQQHRRVTFGKNNWLYILRRVSRPVEQSVQGTRARVIFLIVS
jgi:hypothetical protein